ALFRLLLFRDESGKSGFIPLLFKLLNCVSDVVPVTGRDLGFPEFVEHGAKVVKGSDRRAYAVILPGDIFTNGAKQNGTFGVQDGKMGPVQLRGQVFIGGSEGASDTAA